MPKSPRLIILFLLVLPIAARAEQPAAFNYAEKACSNAEKWHFTSAIPEFAQEDFRSFLNKRSKSVDEFSEALAVRRFVLAPEAKMFGEYWISRALDDGELPHIAVEGFRHIASRAPTPETVGIQLAALACINQIHKEHPAVMMPGEVAARLPELAGLAKFPGSNEVIWEAAGSVIQALVSQEQPSHTAANEMLALLKGSGAHENLAKGLWAAKLNQHPTAVAELEKFVANPSVPASIQRFKSTAHLLLSRSLYSTEKFDQAGQHLKLISKASNELAEALSELSWAYLQGEKYSEAIGTAMNLEAGGMRHTFAPEAPMVMSMALNELCQYPESIRAIDLFKKRYEKPYKWLATWNRDSDLYQAAIQFVKRQSSVPDRIGTEWVRSPLFLASQDEINLLFRERDNTQGLSRAGSVEEKKTAEEIIQLARALKPKLKKAKMKLKPGSELPGSILKDLAYLKRKVNHLRRLQVAGPVWKTILANYKGQVPTLEKKLVARINSDLRDRTAQMKSQIEEIAENTQLIEVEIYNGASQDIIWQNAHPDYKEIAQKLNADRQLASRDKVYDWGKMMVGSDENEEIWEDELGSFKASLFDNCNSKDKYLAIKRIRGAE